MAHYAFLDENNIVTEVIVGIDETETIENLSPETWYGNFRGQKCIRTSYNGKIRRSFAGVGYFYDEEKDIFLAPEYSINQYDAPWMGSQNPVSPSIILDSVARCGNRWFSTCINKAFPNVLQRWGFEFPHNPESFSWAKNKFDVFATVIRNPLDFMASNILYFKADTDEKIITIFNKSISILEKTLENKDGLSVFKFEDITNNIESIISYIGAMLEVSPKDIDFDQVKNDLNSLYGDGDYIVPTNNEEDLNQAKLIISDEKFSIYLNRLNELYNEICKFSWQGIS
jgi:hypothetical protein